MIDIKRIYEAAARAGLLKRVNWISPKIGSRTAWVEWREPDDSILHDLVLASAITMTFPSTEFVGIRQGDAISADGKRYQVREVKVIHDGSESRANLSLL